jgi:formylglycine-generating enzyme required for sulfatase activity
VTQQEYQRVAGKNPGYFSKTGEGKASVKKLGTSGFPVETVSHDDAVAYCNLLSDLAKEKADGRSYRLPTEAEWEYACRGGASSSKPFSFGDSLSSTKANFNGTYPYGKAAQGPYLQRPCPVDSYPSNLFCLHDMHGNVWEWCQDWYAPYNLSIDKDPVGPETSPEICRVLRGGSWSGDGWGCRSAYRGRFAPDGRYMSNGFRLVCVVRTS